jgi:hypothetical protein
LVSRDGVDGVGTGYSSFVPSQTIKNHKDISTAYDISTKNFRCRRRTEKLRFAQSLCAAQQMGKREDGGLGHSKSAPVVRQNCHDNVQWLRDIWACRTKERRPCPDLYRPSARLRSDSARFSPFPAQSAVGMSIAYFCSKSTMTAVRRFVEANAG